jgi:L-fuconolactonase
VDVVDSHCHVALGWYEPLAALLHQMDQNGVEHAILIQIMGQANNDYQAQCVRQHPDRLTSVVGVDAASIDAIATLERHAADGIGGVRLRVNTRSPGDDPLAIWRSAERLALAVSCGGSAAEFAAPAFSQLVAAVPGLRIAIEHLGSVNRPTGNATEEANRQLVFGLARFPNVAMKFHGLGEFCVRAMPVAEPFPFVEPIPPLLKHAYAAFGPDRLMWGSDYPPVSGREGYGNSLRLPMAQFAHLDDQAKAQVFGGTARAFFRPVA